MWQEDAVEYTELNLTKTKLNGCMWISQQATLLSQQLLQHLSDINKCPVLDLHPNITFPLLQNRLEDSD